MNKEQICKKLIDFLTIEINRIDFSILKENYNRLFDRVIHTKIIYEDDEYEDIPFFSKKLEGDDFFLKNELIKQINCSLKEISFTKFDEIKKFDLLCDEFSTLIQAIAISLGYNPLNYEKKINNLKTNN